MDWQLPMLGICFIEPREVPFEVPFVTRGQYESLTRGPVAYYIFEH
jgi:hypothetical protein